MKKQSKRTVRNPLAWIEQRQPLSTKQIQSIGLTCHGALAVMLSPQANESYWAIVFSALNMAYILAEMGVCHDHLLRSLLLRMQ